ncbi:Hypothetical predicted protein [Octopus vulgaris]|uniref:Protein quiver n=1 Tax=Octopus vulgaris TaxID=6645 RepID=A0AA36BRA4_OCTVU|nr:Hypothetical predicted protein [Octopus vulgaris]
MSLSTQTHFFALFISCWLLLLHPVSGIRCFVCENAKSDKECNQPINIKECPKDVSPSQDVCEITQTYSKENGLTINKKCGTGPCHVGAANSRVLGWASQCEKDKPEWKWVRLLRDDVANEPLTRT